MKRLLCIFLLIPLLSGASIHQRLEDYVYISTGPGAYAYHAKLECPSLKKCREEGHVRKITLKEAKQLKRTPCKRCTKK